VPRGRPAKARAGARLFFYGTLLDPDIQRRVVGRALTGAAFVPASLQGFRRVRAAGQWFPILVPGLRSDLVEGGLATDLDGREIARIVAYESTDNYAMKPVSVRLRDGERRSALVFLPISGSAGRLRPTREAWELESWQAREKPRLLRLGLWP
jgi:hypothetical protein